MILLNLVFADESAGSDNYCNFCDSSKARDSGRTVDSGESCDSGEFGDSGEYCDSG